MWEPVGLSTLPSHTVGYPEAGPIRPLCRREDKLQCGESKTAKGMYLVLQDWGGEVVLPTPIHWK